MSGYKKNYTSWTKGNLNPSTYSGNSSSKIETSLKYGSVYSRPTGDSKASSERSTSLRLGQKYGSYSSPHYCDPAHSKESDKYSATTVTARLKETEKRELSQPPVSYRSISRPGTRSRDPSMERDTTDRLSSLSIHNCNTLYPPSINTRSVSHDRSESTTSTSTIPKYTGRSSITKTEKFGLTRTSRNESKEDLSATKYKPLSRATSREDLDSGPKKYITSRFLPKNTIEKSHTAYIRPSSTRISSSQRDTSRKNREILNLLSAQTDSKKTSKSTSRGSNLSELSPSITGKTSTSSNTTSTGVTKSEKVTSDNTSDSTNSKVSNTSATPWSSYLDLKFSSPKGSKTSSQNQPKQSTSSSKLSISSSSKNSSHNQSDSKLKLVKSTSHSLGKAILNKDFRKSVLNMNPESKKCHHNGSVSPAESETEFPLSEATDVSENLSSCVSYHKPSSSSASKLPKRSNVESVDHRSARSNTRSPSIPSEGHSNSTTATSGSEDDLKTKSTTSKSEIKPSKSFLSSRSFLLNEHGDGSEKSPKPPMSPRLKSEKPEVDPKSLLVRTLSPAMGLIKIKHQDSDHRINWMDSTDKETSNASSKIGKSTKEEAKTESASKIKIMRRVDSGERAWWLDENITPPEGVQVYQENSLGKPQDQDSQNDYFQKYLIRPIDSGEKAWWLNSNENISVSLKSAKNEPKYKISHQASGEKAWWLQTPPKSNAHSSQTSESDLEETHDLLLGDRVSPEGLEMPREEEERMVYSKVKKPSSLFISKHKNIDDILGGASQYLSPLMEQIFNYQERKQSVEECQEVQPNQVKIHDSTAQRGIIHPNRLDNVGVISSPSSQADRVSLFVCVIIKRICQN